MIGELDGEARRVLVLAQDEHRISAQGPHIEPCHVLLALLRHGEGPAAEALAALGFGPLDEARALVWERSEARSTEGRWPSIGHTAVEEDAEVFRYAPDFSAAAVDVLRSSRKLAWSIGPSELLLGLLGDGDVAGHLAARGIEVEELRTELLGAMLAAEIQPEG